MSNYLEKYLKYKSKYQQLKNQIGGAKLGDHTWIIDGDYWGIIVGYNSSDNTYVVLQKKNMHGFKEKFLRPENENKIWKVNNSIPIFNPSKKDIKAAEKEFNFSVPKADDSVADSALEKAKQIIKIKVGKILSQPKGQRSKSTDLAVLRQFIQRPDIKKAFKARGLDIMDFVKDVIA